MSENRDEILANFQACTGIDDVELAITQLNDTDWDLARAVNRAIPEESMHRTNDSSPDVEMIQEFVNPNRKAELDSGGPSEMDGYPVDDELLVLGSSASLSRSRMPKNNWRNPAALASTSLGATVRMTVECNGLIHTIEISAHATVLDLKKRIEALTDVPVCRQAITGWSSQPRADSATLSSLGLGPEVSLRVRDTSADGAKDDVVERLNLEYTLNITEEPSGKKFDLKYPGAKSVQEVKMDLHQLCNIPARHQIWSGWPPSISDSTILGLAGLTWPFHSLTVKSRELPSHESKRTKKVQNTEDSEDSSVEEFEDAAETFNGDEDMFLPDSVSRKLRPLMPEKVEDETVGCLHFVDEFGCRYGPMHPEFFPGSLEDAIKEACMKPAKERRLLALYLHHDRSVLANVFCTQLLCSEPIIQVMATYFILWGWDLTCLDNQQRFINSFTSELGSMAAIQIKSIPVERLPAIIIINRVRSNTEILSVIQGNVGIDELTASLSEVTDVFLTQQKVEIREEEERSARETIKMQQDVAFQESLEMDRAKEEARRYQEQAEVKEKQREQQQRDEEAAKKQAEIMHAESRLPDEPPATATDITKIRVRVPQGQNLERRFHETDTLQSLFDWLVTQGYRQDDIKLLSSWPRRELTTLDGKRTFKQLSLCPQETVILEQL